MTMYAAGPVRITAAPQDFDGRMFGFAELQEVTVEVFRVVPSAADTVVQAAAAMDWNETDEVWEYIWNTTDDPPGKYRARVLATDMDGNQWAEHIKMTLKAEPT